MALTPDRRKPSLSDVPQGLLPRRGYDCARAESSMLSISPQIPRWAPASLLVLGRNADEDDGRIQATIFAKDQGAFRVVSELSEGYPMREAVTRLSIPQ